MELRDKNLEKLIRYKLGLFNSQKQLTIDDLNKIEELSLSGTTFSRRRNYC